MPESEQLQKYMKKKHPLHRCVCLWCDHSLVAGN